jgi:hypothetical protein
MRTLALAALVAAAGAAHAGSIEYVDSSAARVAAEALAYLGVPYRLAGVDASGVDCSGLVAAVWDAVTGEKVPRTVTGLIERGARVEGPTHPGDLLFFDTTGGPSHVAIALDERHFVHAASEGPATGVIISSMDERYYHDRFLQARRLLSPGPGRFVVQLDGEPLREAAAAPVAAGTPLEFALAASGERKFATLRAVLDGRQMLERRVSIGGGTAVSVWLVPAPGRWTVSVEAPSGVLAALAFEAGGRP